MHIMFIIMVSGAIVLYTLFRITAMNDYSGDGALAGAVLFGLPAALLFYGAACLGVSLFVDAFIISVPIWLQVIIAFTPVLIFLIRWHFYAE